MNDLTARAFKNISVFLSDEPAVDQQKLIETVDEFLANPRWRGADRLQLIAELGRGRVPCENIPAVGDRIQTMLMGQPVSGTVTKVDWQMCRDCPYSGITYELDAQHDGLCLDWGQDWYAAGGETFETGLANIRRFRIRSDHTAPAITAGAVWSPHQLIL